MPEFLLPLFVAIVCLILGGAGGYFARRYFVDSKIKSVQAQAQDILDKAEATKKEIEVQAKEDIIKLQNEVEQEARRRNNRLSKQEERLQNRQDSMDKRLENLEGRERSLNKRQSSLDKKENEINNLESMRLEELQRIANMTQDEAKKELLAVVEDGARMDMARVIREVETETNNIAAQKAREIITMAIQRIASEQVTEATVSTVSLPSDDVKGRIIGRQGRNIRAFEVASGIEVIVDDTPDAIILTGFDPVRREVAKKAMEALITDGRIHPARIEKVIAKAKSEMGETIRELGDNAAYEAGVHGLHPNLIKLLGQLNFRIGNGQNQRAHAIETAQLASLLAAELGANEKTARMGGLLHDIGKAINHEVDGTHAVIGAEEAKKYNVPAKVINCIASHHHDEEQTCIEAIIVEVANAISNSRPGARREALETYIKRIKELERIAVSFEGVEDVFAIQAGREVRVIVRPEKIDDYQSITLSKDIARKLEENLQYPGQIKVTVIRETRKVNYAK